MRVSRTLSQEQFKARVKYGKKNDRIVYHVGSLMYDRCQGDNFQLVHATGSAAWEACVKGKVSLVQRAVMPLIFEYLAVLK